jgi:hypothetical protein
MKIDQIESDQTLPTIGFVVAVVAASIAVIGITVFGWEMGYEGGGFGRTLLGLGVALIAVVLTVKKYIGR